MIELMTRELPLLGPVTVAATAEGVVLVALEAREAAVARLARRFPKAALVEGGPLCEAALAQLAEYAAGERTRFELPLAPGGTPFQQSVWEAVGAVPYGQTRTYRQIAEAVGRPAAVRAAGAANGANPLCVIIPCHRLLGSDGSLTGYEYGLPMKKALLELEAASC